MGDGAHPAGQVVVVGRPDGYRLRHIVVGRRKGQGAAGPESPPAIVNFHPRGRERYGHIVRPRRHYRQIHSVSGGARLRHGQRRLRHDDIRFVVVGNGDRDRGRQVFVAAADAAAGVRQRYRFVVGVVVVNRRHRHRLRRVPRVGLRRVGVKGQRGRIDRYRRGVVAGDGDGYIRRRLGAQHHRVGGRRVLLVGGQLRYRQHYGRRVVVHHRDHDPVGYAVVAAVHAHIGVVRKGQVQPGGEVAHIGVVRRAQGYILRGVPVGGGESQRQFAAVGAAVVNGHIGMAAGDGYGYPRAGVRRRGQRHLVRRAAHRILVHRQGGGGGAVLRERRPAPTLPRQAAPRIFQDGILLAGAEIPGIIPAGLPVQIHIPVGVVAGVAGGHLQLGGGALGADFRIGTGKVVVRVAPAGPRA